MFSSMPYSLTHNESPLVQRSKFKRDSDNVTAFDAGQLIPIYLDMVMPGDTFNMQATHFGRLNTLIFPIMDNLYLDVHWFFVPMRLVWANFRKAMGEVPLTDNPLNYTMPRMDPATYNTATGFALNSLPDYLGLPILVPVAVPSAIIPISSLPFRAYNLIYNSYYMDQNLQSPVFFVDDDTSDDFADYTVLNRGKRKDYFTSAAIDPQKLWLNDTAPLIPSSVDSLDVPVTLNPPTGALANWTARTSSTGNLYAGPNPITVENNSHIMASGAVDLSLDPNGSLETVLTPADFMGTIDQLAVAVQMQRFLQRDNRGGTRYPELVWSHFKVITPDLMWRPQYLGGSSDRVNISPVQQTSETGTTPQGNLAAQGNILTNSRFVQSFHEHGYVMGIASLRADLRYQQNCDRLWFAYDNRYDFPWPTFVNLGEQPVYLCELWATEASWSQNLPGFGFQERYADWKFKNSTVTGIMRSQAPASLDAWHLGQEFASPPTLDNTFIQENPPIDRVVAVNTEPAFVCNNYFKLVSARCLPMFSTPGIMGRF